MYQAKIMLAIYIQVNAWIPLFFTQRLYWNSWWWNRIKDLKTLRISFINLSNGTYYL
jgi:hypothetical protein